MPRLGPRSAHRPRILLLLCLVAMRAWAVPENDPRAVPRVRWNEGSPGCTFSRTDDGHYVYSMSSGDLVISMSVDAQEVEKVQRRHEPFFALLLRVRVRGSVSVDLATEHISLEFVKHDQVVQPALEPDAFAAKVQNDADERDQRVAREVAKHPERRESEQAYMRAYQKETAELLEFISKNSLRAARLNSDAPEISGCLLFSTNIESVGSWKRQEEFVLRVPIAGVIYEFPFKLPPRPGEVILRRRE